MLRVLACAMLVVACARTPSPSPPPAVPSVAPHTPADRDGDGFLDAVDRCPQDPGGEPDGCPIPDSDGDGILDPDDRCVDLPETRNGMADGDGCPDTLPPGRCKHVDGSPRPALFGPAPPPPATLQALARPLPDVPRLASSAVVVPSYATDEHGFVRAPTAPLRVPISTDDSAFRDLERLVAAGGFADEAHVDPAEYVQIASAAEPVAPGWQLSVELGPCPWQPRHRLARIRVQAPPRPTTAGPRQIALLVETGRATAATWPTIHAALVELATRHLTTGDSIAVITYGADTRVVVPATTDRATLLAGLARLSTPSRAPPVAGPALAQALATLDPKLPGARVIVIGHDDPTRLAATTRTDLAALRSRASIHLVRTADDDALAWSPALREAAASVDHARSFHALHRAIARSVRADPTPAAHAPVLEIRPVPAAIRTLRWLGGDDPQVLCDGPRLARPDDLDPGEAATILLELDVAATSGLLATLLLRDGSDGPALREAALVAGPDAAPSLAMQVARIAAELALLQRPGERAALADIFSARGGRRLAALEREAAASIDRDPSRTAARLHAVLVGLRRALPAARRLAVAGRELHRRRLDDADHQADVRRHAAVERAARRLAPADYFARATELTVAGGHQVDVMVGLMRADRDGLRWQLVGHCDELEAADPSVCAALAARRVEVVRARLLLRGVNPALLDERLATADERDPPRAADALERAEQRRVDFAPVVDP